MVPTSFFQYRPGGQATGPAAQLTATPALVGSCGSAALSLLALALPAPRRGRFGMPFALTTLNLNPLE